MTLADPSSSDLRSNRPRIHACAPRQTLDFAITQFCSISAISPPSTNPSGRVVTYLKRVLCASASRSIETSCWCGLLVSKKQAVVLTRVHVHVPTGVYHGSRSHRRLSALTAVKLVHNIRSRSPSSLPQQKPLRISAVAGPFLLPTAVTTECVSSDPFNGTTRRDQKKSQPRERRRSFLDYSELQLYDCQKGSLAPRTKPRRHASFRTPKLALSVSATATTQPISRNCNSSNSQTWFSRG
jgi:hypothetical protein